MKVNSKMLLLAGALCVTAGSVAAAGFFTNGVPVAGGTQYPATVPLTGNETLPADTNLPSGLNPASEAITTNQMGAFTGSQPSKTNALIGGDATTNLWQRSTTAVDQTSTVAYGAPDRWAYWSGTNTSMAVVRDSTAADLPSGYKFSFQMIRSPSVAGVVQMCMAQEILSANSYQFQGATAELDFHAIPGANFSPTNGNMTAYIITGTGTDEGMSSMAFGLNAGGGGSGGWTGQANATAAVVSVTGGGRFAAIANIPATATEIGVALCYTPVGTAGAADYVSLAGIQLTRNNNLASLASTTVGYNDTGLQAAAFERRSQSLETVYQYAYYWQDSELNGSYLAPGLVTATNTETAVLELPVVMRVAPACTYTAGGFRWNINGTQVNVNTLNANDPTSQFLTIGDDATATTPGQTAFLNGNNTTGRVKCNSEL